MIFRTTILLIFFSSSLVFALPPGASKTDQYNRQESTNTLKRDIKTLHRLLRRIAAVTKRSQQINQPITEEVQTKMKSEVQSFYSKAVKQAKKVIKDKDD